MVQVTINIHNLMNINEHFRCVVTFGEVVVLRVLGGKLLCCEFRGVVLWVSGKLLCCEFRGSCCVVSSGGKLLCCEFWGVVFWLSGKLLCCEFRGKGGTYRPPYISAFHHSGVGKSSTGLSGWGYVCVIPRHGK